MKARQAAVALFLTTSATAPWAALGFTNALQKQRQSVAVERSTPSSLFSQSSLSSFSGGGFRGNSSPLSETDLRRMYDDWRQKYNKGPYDGYRFQVWKQNFWACQRIQVQNAIRARVDDGATDEGESNPTQLNEFGDLTQEEFKAWRNVNDKMAWDESKRRQEQQRPRSPFGSQPYTVGGRARVSQKSRAIRNDQSDVMLTSVRDDYTTSNTDRIVRGVGSPSYSRGSTMGVSDNDAILRSSRGTLPTSAEDSLAPEELPPFEDIMEDQVLFANDEYDIEEEYGIEEEYPSTPSYARRPSRSIRNDQKDVMTTSPVDRTRKPSTLGVSDNDYIVRGSRGPQSTSAPRNPAMQRTQPQRPSIGVSDNDYILRGPSQPVGDLASSIKQRRLQVDSNDMGTLDPSREAPQGSTQPRRPTPPRGPRSAVSYKTSRAVRNDQTDVMRTSLDFDTKYFDTEDSGIGSFRLQPDEY